MFDDDDLPRRKKFKRRGEDPELDALVDELAKETGDPLFWDVSKYLKKEGPGVIVAGGLDEAKAHVKGIRPPAGVSGGVAEEKRVVVATEVERRETISAALHASREAAKRGVESARREEAERTTAVRTVPKAGRVVPETRKRTLQLGAVGLLLVVAASGAYVLGMKRGAEPVGPNVAVPVQAPVVPASVVPAATQAAPATSPTSEPAPAVSATPTSMPAERAASVAAASSDEGPAPSRQAVGSGVQAAPARPKASATAGDSYEVPSVVASSAVPTAPRATSSPAAPPSPVRAPPAPAAPGVRDPAMND